MMDEPIPNQSLNHAQPSTLNGLHSQNDLTESTSSQHGFSQMQDEVSDGKVSAQSLLGTKRPISLLSSNTISKPSVRPSGGAFAFPTSGKGNNKGMGGFTLTMGKSATKGNGKMATTNPFASSSASSSSMAPATMSSTSAKRVHMTPFVSTLSGGTMAGHNENHSNSEDGDEEEDDFALDKASKSRLMSMMAKIEAVDVLPTTEEGDLNSSLGLNATGSPNLNQIASTSNGIRQGEDKAKTDAPITMVDATQGHASSQVFSQDQDQDEDADLRELDEKQTFSMKEQRERIRAKLELQRIADAFGGLVNESDALMENSEKSVDGTSMMDANVTLAEVNSNNNHSSELEKADNQSEDQDVSGSRDELDKYMEMVSEEARTLASLDRERSEIDEKEELAHMLTLVDQDKAHATKAKDKLNHNADGELNMDDGEKHAGQMNERIFDDENELTAEDYEQGGADTLSWLERQALAKNRKDLKPVDHSTIEYLPFRKNFYAPHPEVAALTEEEVKRIREVQLGGIRVRGLDVPKPVTKWVHCGFASQVDELLARRGLVAPFPIQAQVLPVIMSGRDCLVCAQTGSGKTLAFVLPMIRHVLDQPPLDYGDGPIGLVLAPTRELAVQIAEEVSIYSLPFASALLSGKGRRGNSSLGVLKVNACYGGAPIAEQIARLRGGSQVVVATPGRLIDLLTANRGKVTNLRRVTYLVMDEADRMFDMGFKPQITRIISNIRPDRQTLLFSATFPPAVEQLAKQVLVRPIEIVMGGRSIVSSSISQLVEIIEEEDKMKRLLDLLRKWYSPEHNILIFTNKKEHADLLQRKLAEAGYSALSLHGSMDQVDRDHTLQMFKSKLRTVLVATSIVARGLDVKDLKLVINYSAPTHYEDYVHRIGRTGRAGEKGTAITFLTPDEEQVSLDIVKGMVAAKQPVPSDLKSMAEAFKDKVRKNEAVWHSRDGYRTKGFKFDESEDDRTKRMAAVAAESGEMENDDVDDELTPQDQGDTKRTTGATGDAVDMSGIVVLDANTGRPVGEPSTTKSSTSQPSSSEQVATSNQASQPQLTGSAVPTPQISTAKLTLAQQLEAAKALAQVARNLAQSKDVGAAEKLAQTKATLLGEFASGAVASSDSVQPQKPRSNEELVQAARAIATSIEQKTGAGATTSASSTSATAGGGNVMVEFEINDYPQTARWRCTRRESLTEVMEDYSVSIVTRGVYVPPGTRIQPDERKLYLLIQGTSVDSVRQATAELKRRLNAESETAQPQQALGAYGRFTI